MSSSNSPGASEDASENELTPAADSDAGLWPHRASDHGSSDHPHPHDHRAHARQHTHGAIDPGLFSTERGIWAVKWSLAGLLITALLQAGIVLLTGSIALFADTIHNFGDGLTAIPLWIAFKVGQRQPSKRFTYGYGRLEDLAGLAILLMILVSAAIAGVESFARLVNPQEIRYIWAVIGASLLGFIGNEAVSIFRIKIGKEIGSASLVADGYHARVDGLSSLAVLAGALGVALGFPLADPLAGLLITAVILKILWDTGKSIFRRLLDGIDPQVVDEIEYCVRRVPGVQDITQIRVRWLGHRLNAELDVTVDDRLTVAEGHSLAREVYHRLKHELEYLSEATIHVDPANSSGKSHHHFDEHVHDEFPSHSHG